MAENEISSNSVVRPSRDAGAPWSANAARQARERDDSRSVVYCVVIEDAPLLKIGRTTQLKRRVKQLKDFVGRELHIGYWAEFSTDDAKDVERCALLRMRKQFVSEGEWSLANPAYGAAAIQCAADFLGVKPVFEAGAPMEAQPEDEYAYLRTNKMDVKHKSHNAVDRAYWEDPFTLNRS